MFFLEKIIYTVKIYQKKTLIREKKPLSGNMTLERKKTYFSKTILISIFFKIQLSNKNITSRLFFLSKFADRIFCMLFVKYDLNELIICGILLFIKSSQNLFVNLAADN